MVLRPRRSNIVSRQSSNIFGRKGFGSSKKSSDTEVVEVSENQARGRSKTHTAFSILYFLLVLAQILMCILEIVRLSLTHLGIGLLPFTFVTLAIAFALRLTRGFRNSIEGWRWASLSVWIALAITNGMKIAEETKEGTGARKGSKYPVADEMTDVGVMIGVYVALAMLEVLVRP